ncbi:MAG: nucleotide-binding protein [Planctomycetaceae bacterium]|nr:nucleotide-binding protein [Planctomycetaceae bacterium]
MSKPKKPTLVKLCEMLPGQSADCFAQLVEKTHRSTRDGKPFYSCRFRDPHRTASVMVWADGGFYEDCQARWQIGGFFKIRGVFSEHEKYGPQLDVEQVRTVLERDRDDGFTELDFMERSRLDPQMMLAELRAVIAKEIADEPLLALVQKILAAHEAELKLLPASARHYYPFAGGWLEHTLSVVRSCVFLADRYAAQFPDMKPPLNRDLVIAGAVLHDIGRVKELEVSVPGQPVRAGISGELFGHLFLAYDLIRAAANDVPDLNPELLELLLHVVVSHLRIPEWGSPRLPCIPEVLILHHADDLDAKFEMYARCLTRDTTDGPFTERDPVLGRPLLKQRTV